MKLMKIKNFFKKSVYCEGIACYLCKNMIMCYRSGYKKTFSYTVKDDILGNLDKKDGLDLF